MLRYTIASLPHRHSRFLPDEIPPQNHTRKKKYRRYSRRSRYSGSTTELEVQHPLQQHGSRSESSGGGSSKSTFSLTLTMNKIGVDKPNHHPSPTLAPSIASSNPVELYSPCPTIELPLPSSSHHEPIHPPTHTNPALLPEIERQRLNILIQQRAVLLASGNTNDKSVYAELSLLEEQIQILQSRHDVSLPPQQDIPPPYEDEQ